MDIKLNRPTRSQAFFRYIKTRFDPKIESISEITCIKALFDYEKTNIEQFDLIVGQEPCMATEHIVISTILNNKAYIEIKMVLGKEHAVIRSK